jgi:hypothetical protein
MRLSKDSVSASRCTLALAVILLFSSNTFAQHSGGGGSSGGGSSSGGGGGGSHGASSGGSVSSGGGHSSGGGSSSHSSAGHSSSAGSASSHSGTSHSNSTHSNTAHSNTAHPNTVRPTREPRTEVRGTAQTPHKHGFFSFSFLRHHIPRPLPNPPGPKPEPKQPVAELRRPICFRGPCLVCPAGQVHGANGCGGNIIQNRIERRCPAGEYWAIGGCVQQTWYQDECGGLRMMMERQAKRMQAAEQDRQISCALGPWQQCSDSTSSAASETGFYQELQNRYQVCQRRSPTAFPHNGFRVPGYSAGVSFDSLSLGLGRR